MTIRRRSEPPSVPPGYGTDDVRWQPSARHDVVLVAGHYLQHLISRKVRAVLGTKAEAHVAEHLQVNVKTARRLLAGEQFMKITELVELALLAGPDVLRSVPPDLAGLFPAEYHPMLARWDRTPGAVPSFTAPDLTGAELWRELTERLTQWLSEEGRTYRARLIESSVVAYRLVGCLAELGVPPDLVLPNRDAAPRDWAGLRVVATTTVSLWVAYLHDEQVDPRSQWGTVLNGLRSLGAGGSPGVAMIIMDDRLRAQIVLHTPHLLSAAADEDVTIPFGTVGRLGLPELSDINARDVILRVLARAETTGALVMAVAVTKP